VRSLNMIVLRCEYATQTLLGDEDVGREEAG
jgi:hypothetical protein